MSVERIETLIVGGGQAGLAMSHMLTLRGCSHLVLDIFASSRSSGCISGSDRKALILKQTPPSIYPARVGAGQQKTLPDGRSN